MTRVPAKTKGEMEAVFRLHPDRGAVDNLRLREALKNARDALQGSAEARAAAREMAEKALAIWPEKDEF